MKFGPKQNSDEINFANPPEVFEEILEEISFDSFHKDLHKKKSPKINSDWLSSLTKEMARKFKSTILNKTFPSKNCSNLLKVIDDLAFFNQHKKKNGPFQNFMKFINGFFQNLIISPVNPLRMIWNIFSLIFMSFCFVNIPFEMSFGIENGYFIDLVIFLVFSFDFILNFITGDFIQGFLVMDPKVLFKKYLKGLFLFDALAFVYAIIELTMQDEDIYVFDINIGTTYRFLVLAKIPRFFNCTKIVLSYLKLEYKYQNMVDICKLLFFSLFVVHLLACLWHLCTQLDQKHNWLIKFNIQKESKTTKYIYSLYWTVVTMMTVGYGDITPQNELETIYAIIAIIFGCGLYAFNLNSIGIILQNNHKRETELRNQLRIINNFMDRKNIDIKLQRKVQEYLNFLCLEQNSNNNEDELAVINKLNETLREELLLESYGGIFINSPLFLKNFSEKSLRKIVKIIKEVKLIPGDYVFEEENLDDCSMYFINNGSVEIFRSRTNIENHNLIKILEKGEIFGEYSFFTGSRRDFSCKSIGFSSLLIINRDLALEIFKENEEDFERFSMIKDEILLKNSFSLISHRCLYCRSFKHIIKFCPFLHYIADKEKIIKRNEFYFEEPRKKIERRKKQKFSREKLIKRALKFQETQEERNVSILPKNLIDRMPEIPVESLDYLDEDQNSVGPGFPLVEKKEMGNNNVEEKENGQEIDMFMKEKMLSREIEKEPLSPFLISEGKKELLSPLLETFTEILTKPNRSSIINKKNSFLDHTASDVFGNRQKYLMSKSKSKLASNPQISSCQITMEKNKETNITQNIFDLQNVFEHMKYYKNYYPKMNYLDVIQNVNKANRIQKKFKEFVVLFYPDKDIKKKIHDKIQKMQKYTIHSGKIADLIMMNIIKKLKLEIPSLSRYNSPTTTGIKKKKTFKGFFDRNQMRSDKDFKSLISKVIKHSKNKKLFPQKRTFWVKLFKNETKAEN